MKNALAVCGLTVAVAAAAWAQAPEGPGAPRRGSVARGEIFRMVDAYVVSNLQESLGLTDQEFVKLLPLVKRLQTERRESVQRRLRAVHALRRTLSAGGATEAQVAGKLTEVKAAEAEEAAALRRNREAVDAALSPVQQAKFRVMEAEIEHKLRELMTEMRGRAGRRPGGKAPKDPEN